MFEGFSFAGDHLAVPTNLDREWVQALVEHGYRFEEIRDRILSEGKFVPERLGALIMWATELTGLDED